MPTVIDQQQLAQELVAAAPTDGGELVGPGGLLTGLTKAVLETALEAEMSEHLGYDKHDPSGRNRAKSLGTGRQFPRPGHRRHAGQAAGGRRPDRAVTDRTGVAH